MRRSGQIYSHQNRAVLSFALVVALLVQGVFGASGACMMSMEPSDIEQAQTISHEGHDMSGHEMAAHDASSDDGAAVKSQGHRCPPNGCDICDGNNCSQCSPFQFSAIILQGPIFLKDPRLAILGQAKVLAFIVSSRHWSLPPGRAPPQIL